MTTNEKYAIRNNAILREVKNIVHSKIVEYPNILSNFPSKSSEIIYLFYRVQLSIWYLNNEISLLLSWLWEKLIQISVRGMQIFHRHVGQAFIVCI